MFYIYSQARVEAQSFRLTCEDAPTVEYMARFIAKTQQRYTQRGGVRPFGVSGMMAGFSPEGKPQLYLTDPAGTYSSWKANCIGGRNEKAVREFLEKNWAEGLAEADAVKLAVRALLEVVDSGSRNMEVAVITRAKAQTMIPEQALADLIATIEREAEEAKKAAQEAKMDLE